VWLLRGATSSSMLRRDSEIECLHEELDGTSDDDDILLPRHAFSMIRGDSEIECLFHHALLHKFTTHPGVS
jgi:hypothetical protein